MIGDTLKISSYADSSAVVAISSLGVAGNDMRISSIGGEVWIDDVVDDVTINLIPPNYNKFVKVVISGDFLVGEEELKGNIKIMKIYKCFKEITIRHMHPKDDDLKSYGPTYECRFIKDIKVNSYVSLTEVSDLPDYLIVRYKSDNSVVYYKVEKYDYTHVEINLKGYDPSYVNMVQLDSSDILILHFKIESANPLMLFSLDGESLLRRPEPDLQQFVYPGLLSIFRFAGITRNKEGNYDVNVVVCYPDHVSFVRFVNVTSNTTDYSIVMSHDILEGRSLHATSSAVCFFSGYTFFANQVSETQVEAFLVDPLNPGWKYRYPLSEYNISMNGISVKCDTEKKIVVLQGLIPDSKWKMRVYLNATEGSPDTMILKKIRDKSGVECYFGWTSVYFNEVCMTTSVSSNLPISVRFLRIGDPILHFAGSNKDRTDLVFLNLPGTNRKSLLEFSLSPQTKNWIDLVEMKENSSTSLVTSILYSNESTVSINLYEVLNFTGHVLNVQMTFFNTKANRLVRNAEVYGIKINERIYQKKAILRMKSTLEETKQEEKESEYPSIDRIVKHGNIVMTLTLLVKYQVISTMFRAYYFDADSLELKEFNQFKVDALCKELDFITSHSPEDEASPKIHLATYCQIGRTASIRLFDFSTTSAPTIEDSLILQTDLRSDPRIQITVSSIKGNDTYDYSIYLSSIPADSFIYGVDMKKRELVNIYYDQSSHRNRLMKIKIDGDNYIMYIDKNGHIMYGNLEWVVGLDMKRKQLHIDKDHPNKKVEDFQCHQTIDMRSVRCYASLDVYYVPTFRLVRNESDGSLIVVDAVRQWLVPGSTVQSLYITQDHMIVDVILINKGSMMLHSMEEQSAGVLRSRQADWPRVVLYTEDWEVPRLR